MLSTKIKIDCLMKEKYAKLQALNIVRSKNIIEIWKKFLLKKKQI